MTETTQGKALIGVEEIAQFIEQLWRERQRRRGVRISARSVRRWLNLQRDPLPATRMNAGGRAGGPWIAGREEVIGWWERRLISTGRSELPKTP